MDFDDIYKIKDKLGDFRFDSKVSRVFDDMVNRSVPGYQDAQKIAAQLIKKKINPCSTIYDLGCATGNTLILLDQCIDENVQLVGIDNSNSMLEKAREKISYLHKMENYCGVKDRINFECKDINEIDMFPSAGCFILNLTLQFIRPILRPVLIKRLYKSLQDKGILILFEKTVEEEAVFNRLFIELHHDFKRKSNYSEMEISKKREELENVLVPYTEKENHQLLTTSGFRKISTLYKYLNFNVTVAIK